MANRIQETQIQNRLKSDFQLLKLFNGHVIAWHKTKGPKAAFLEHVIGRISCVVIPLFVSGDVIIGIGLFLKRSFQIIIIRPFKKDVDVTREDVYETAKRVVIIVVFCPLFAFATLVMPEKSAYFYFKMTSQNPYCVPPGIPERDYAMDTPNTKTDHVTSTAKEKSTKSSTTPTQKKTTSKDDKIAEDPISSMLERAKSLSTLVVQNEVETYDSDWDDVPTAQDHQYEVRTISVEKMPQMLYSEPKTGRETQFDRHQNEFLERYQKILKGNPYKAPIPTQEKPEMVLKPLKKVEKIQHAHPTISRANTPLTERDFKARLAKANLSKTRLLIPHSEQSTILEVEQLDQYVFERNIEGKNIVFLVHLTHKLSTKFQKFIIEEDC